MDHVKHWINGELSNLSSARRGDIYNPATGQISGNVDFADSTVVDEAVRAAREG